jgi:phosphate-selective porin
VFSISNAADGSEHSSKIHAFAGVYSLDSDSDDELLLNLRKRRKLKKTTNSAVSCTLKLLP